MVVAALSRTSGRPVLVCHGRPVIVVPDPLHELYLDALAGGGVTPHQLCLVSVGPLGMDRAALLSRIGPGQLEVAGASDATVAHLAEVQVTLGDGPVVEALVRGGPVLVYDVARTPVGRWPLLTASADGADLWGAVFALPLHRGAIEVGVLLLHRADTTPLGRGELATVLNAAETITAILLLLGGHDPSTPAAGSPPRAVWPQDNPLTAQVHQATGMVFAQLDTTMSGAYLRLRSHAVTHNISLADAARAVVERRLRFEP